MELIPTAPLKILWFGSEVPTDSSASLEIHSYTQPNPPACEVALVSASHSHLTLLPHLATRMPLVLWTRDIDDAGVRAAVNSQLFFSFLDAKAPMEEWRERLEGVISAWQEKKRKSAERGRTITDLTARNADLEMMNQYLEMAAGERLQILEKSMAEERAKIQRERQFIRFLGEVAAMNSMEDFLRSLRREFRRFHHIQSFFVLIPLESERRVQIHFCEHDKVSFFEARDSGGGADEKSFRQRLANAVGRPFNRLELFSIRMPHVGGTFLGFESLGSEEKDAEVREIIQERLRPLEIVIERFFLEQNKQRFARRWERTFDSFNSPVAVITPELTVLRGNRAYMQNRMQNKCYQVLAQRESPCEGCPVAADPAAAHKLEGVVQVGRRYYRLHSWPVQELQSSQISGRVMHYDDLTESREVHLRMLQNEKMSAIGELAGHIAHELNNPLTGIRSLAQVLKAEADDETLRQDLHQIEHAASRCQKLIRHLMDFSQGGKGITEEVTLDEIVENTLPLLKSSLRPHRQEIVLESAALKIRVDPHLIQQVVFNLVNNACQAMTSAGAVSVLTRVVDLEAGPGVRLEVTDTGPGIPEDIRERLFEPFVSTKPEGEGTGLGLSTSKTIVERFGGRVYFKSGETGTSFFVEFPGWDGK